MINTSKGNLLCRPGLKATQAIASKNIVVQISNKGSYFETSENILQALPMLHVKKSELFENVYYSTSETTILEKKRFIGNVSLLLHEY